MLVQLNAIDDLGAETNHWQPIVDEETTRLATQHLLKDSPVLSDHLERRIGQLKPVRAPLAGQRFFQQPAGFYLRSDLEELAVSTTAEVAAALLYPGLDPVRQHFEAKLAAISIPEESYVPREAVERTFASFREVIAGITSIAGDLSIDLLFLTRPVETEGTMLTLKSCKLCPEIFSQGGAKRLYRGRYDYTVTRHGYDSFSSSLDLIDDPGTKLVCTLSRSQASGPGGPSRCSLEQR
jgi:hypothetical protein